jgi:hypothetical protein
VKTDDNEMCRLAEKKYMLFFFCLALFVYWGCLIVHTGNLFPQSKWPYFVYYAQALLDGHLYFTNIPPSIADLSLYQGKVYMHFPPFPSFLLLPLVKLFGLSMSGRFICVLLGAINGALFFKLLRTLNEKKIFEISLKLAVFTTIFFLFGTVHLYCSITSNPWEFAHIVCNFLLISSLILALNRKHEAALIVYSAILFTRTHIFLTLPVIFFLYWYLEEKAGKTEGEILKRAVFSAIIPLVGIILLLLFNYVRFEDIFENGIRYHQMHPMFRVRFEELGYFNFAYLPINLKAMFLQLPVLIDKFPYLSFTPKGLSLFAASPLYIYLFLSLRKEYAAKSAVLWGCTLLALVPILLLMGTGEFQFGHRYSSDLQVFLCVLVLIGL